MDEKFIYFRDKSRPDLSTSTNSLKSTRTRSAETVWAVGELLPRHWPQRVFTPLFQYLITLSTMLFTRLRKKIFSEFSTKHTS